jgi:type IV pilus assembly protein PilV
MNPRPGVDAQRGSMLLEGLIAILIFSMGILALVGLQAVSIKNTADAKYRSDAAFLANQILGQMWADNPSNLATYAHNATTTSATQCTFSGGGSGTSYGRVTAWIGAAGTGGTVLGTLPGATSSMQQIVVANDGTVTVRICWRQPNQSLPNRLEAVAQIVGG